MVFKRLAPWLGLLLLAACRSSNHGAQPGPVSPAYPQAGQEILTGAVPQVYASVASSTSTLSSPGSPVHSHFRMGMIHGGVTTYGNNASHRRMVVSNVYGDFFTYVVSYGATTHWRLVWRPAGYQNFYVAYERADHHATVSPNIETDGRNLFLIDMDWAGGTGGSDDAVFYRFGPENSFSAPRVESRIAGAASEKFSSLYDSLRHYFLYYGSRSATASDPNRRNFYYINGNGGLVNAISLNKYDAAVNYGYLHYPHIEMTRTGAYLAGWTSGHRKDLIDNYQYALYRDIHFMKSADGGNSWTTSSGNPLSVPVYADETGPAEAVMESYNSGVNHWLANMRAKGDYVHFLQLRADGTHYYVRWNLVTGTADRRVAGLKGESYVLGGQHAFFASDENRLVAVSSSYGEPDRLVAIYSDDDGATWHDLARTDPIGSSKGVFQTTGIREITPDGRVIGTFSLSVPGSEEIDFYFFELPVYP